MYVSRINKTRAPSHNARVSNWWSHNKALVRRGISTISAKCDRFFIGNEGQHRGSMAAQGRAINVMGKPVYLHFNGDIFKRKRIVVNQRKMRSFDSFLDAATTSLGKPAREIRTPHGRTRIRNLEDLQRDCTYVVMGREKKPFKEVNYASSRSVCQHAINLRIGVPCLIEM